jgi:hypothetical protein
MSAPRFHGLEKHPMLMNAFQRNAFLIWDGSDIKGSNIPACNGVEP